MLLCKLPYWCTPKTKYYRLRWNQPAVFVRCIWLQPTLLCTQFSNSLLVVVQYQPSCRLHTGVAKLYVSRLTEWFVPTYSWFAHVSIFLEYVLLAGEVS